MDLATGETSEPKPVVDSLASYASQLGRMGGLKGGKARAKALTAEQRSKIAQKAAKKRWQKKKKD